MSAPDVGPARARRTPYEMVFVEGGFEPRLDDIRAEAAERGSNVAEPEQLIMLTEAGRLIRELLPEDADPLSVLDAGKLIFHAFHLREAGLSTYGLEQGALLELLEERPAGAVAGSAQPPVPAGYLQLPRNAVWAQVAQDAPWESVDGVFWTVAGAGGTPAGGVHALLVVGLRPDRPGFSVVAVAAADPPEEGDWALVRARPEGQDFANVLPGGELSGLHALLNGAEVLKLVSRFFHHMAAHPDAVEPEPPEPAAEGARASTVVGRRFRVRAGCDGR